MISAGDKHFKKEEIRQNTGWVRVGMIDVNEKLHQVEINKNVYNFKQVLSAEIIQDDKTISITERRENGKTKGKIKKHAAPGKAIAGAALGGFMLGGVGALAGGIIGGNSGKKTYTQKSNVSEIIQTIENDVCNTLIIKVKVDSFTNPYELINIIAGQTRKDGTWYRVMCEEAIKMQGVLENILSYNEKNE